MGRTLITADGQHWFTTEEVNNDYWVASFPVPTLSGISGVTLPWNTAQQKFYGIGNSGKLTQTSLNTAAQMFSPNDKIINVFPRRDTPVTTVSTAYTAGGRNYINVFSMVSGKNTRHKIQSVVSSDDGNTWPVSVIAMKF
ncbi:hypothetical protein FRB95_005188 [Tulasnella sp. JGI-2019a]|nr:hypothetical protein FRB95_005188 [Tulasnella sp. JGI-2019a]